MEVTESGELEKISEPIESSVTKPHFGNRVPQPVFFIGDSTTKLGNPFPRLIIFSVMFFIMSNLNLPWCS